MNEEYLVTEELRSSGTLQSLQKDKSTEWWRGSMFEQFALIRSPRSRGAVGEKLVSDIMELWGSKVKRSRTANYDRIIDNIPTEIKVSTTWNCMEDNFRWSQIRNQPYERIIFGGINPNEAKLAWATKDDLQKWVFTDSNRQHAGKNGGLDIYWVSGSIEMNNHFMRPIREWYTT